MSTTPYDPKHDYLMRDGNNMMLGKNYNEQGKIKKGQTESSD